MKNTFLIIISFIIFGCSNNKKAETTPIQVSKTITKSKATHKGAKIVKQLCVSCHSNSASLNARIAPPLVAVKAHYIDKQTTKQEFIKELKNFLKKPTKEKAKLRGAVKRFGVMPYIPISDEQIEQVGEYLFEYEIPEPEWFKEHWKERHNELYINSGKKISKTEPKNLKDKGLEYAINTKKVLGKNLMSTIQKEGTVKALSFCNERAYPLTDSMAVLQKASIKRVSDKPRNPKNNANDQELQYIKFFKKKLLASEDYEPIINVNDQKVKFYFPITTNSMCLQCHGKPNKDIKPQTLKKLTTLYPNDKAIGYDVNEIRGIWSITYNK